MAQHSSSPLVRFIDGEPPVRNRPIGEAGLIIAELRANPNKWALIEPKRFALEKVQEVLRFAGCHTRLINDVAGGRSLLYAKYPDPIELE